MPFEKSKNRPLVIRTNYGDDSIALVQWAYEALLQAVTVVYIDTGFAASHWETRIHEGEAHVRNCGYHPLILKAPISFEAAVIGRNAFPSPKFQWCTGLLKGLPFLDWLESIDLANEMIVLLAKRRAAANAHALLPEWIEQCEFHNDRTVWHPMISVSDIDRDALLARAGFSPLGHRSLECHPCVNSTEKEFSAFSKSDLDKVKVIEKTVGKSFLETLKVESQNQDKEENNLTYLDRFYRGCGNHFGCGL